MSFAISLQNLDVAQEAGIGSGEPWFTYRSGTNEVDQLGVVYHEDRKDG